MNKICSFKWVVIAIASLLHENAWGQAYLNFSKYSGGMNTEKVTNMQVVNGETYVLGYTNSADFPVTNGSIYKGGYDITLTKYGTDGAIIYSTYIGGSSFESGDSMKIVNGEVFIAGYTGSADLPVTNGTAYGGSGDIFIAKINAAGGIVFYSYLGGNFMEFFQAFEIIGNEIFITGDMESLGIPGNGPPGFFITKFSATDGSLILSEILDRNSLYEQAYILNGAVYVVMTTYSIDLPVTIGNTPTVPATYGPYIYVTKLNSSDLSIVYSRYLYGNAGGQVSDFQIISGEAYLIGYTSSTDFPVTNGSSASPALNDQDGFFAKLNVDGSIAFSTYLGTNDNDYLGYLQISNGETYIVGTTSAVSNFQDQNLLVCKINANSSVSYTRTVGKILSGTITCGTLNGNLYLAGINAASTYPVTNATQHLGYNTGYFTMFDASGNIRYSTFLGVLNTLLPMQIVNNKIYLSGNMSYSDFTTTNGSTIAGEDDNMLFVLNPDGSNFFLGFTGGIKRETPTKMVIENNHVYLAGITESGDYPVTNNILYKGANDQFLTKLSFCGDKYNISEDTVLPNNQTTCKYGLGQPITGVEIKIPSDSLPTIYQNGIAHLQNNIGGATYQWQLAYAPSGPWADIPEATFKDYTPVSGTLDQYYRRLSFSESLCGSSLIHISDTASVSVNALTAPTINTDGPFHTCPGVAINIGGSPTVTGGNLPYVSYDWDMGASPEQNPSVAPAVNTIYTLVVTDALGCRQIGQALVLVHRADSGPDKNNCAGSGVRLGTIPITDLPGIVYDWQPASTLSDPAIAQPFATPVTTTEYLLTLTIPKSGGGTCITKDTIKVITVAAPVTASFAGTDKVICRNDSISLGTPPETGFVYGWSPATYLRNQHFSTATYYYPGAELPVPNPAIINLIAQKEGCSFTDQLAVTTIESRAGETGCGPRLVGLPDRTPNINENYTWVKVSGPGNFTGPTNFPQVPVSASIGGTTIYGLTVSYNGGSCYSEVSVPDSCNVGAGSCMIEIKTDARYHCPGYSVNNGNVTLTANSNITNAVYSWSPQVGLSAYNLRTVHLTDNTPRLYTVTVTDANDPSIRCSTQLFANDPLFAAPVFPAPDTATCANVPLNIGLPPSTGYTYEWSGSGLSNYFISNPVATVAAKTLYKVKITNGTGCELNDTVIVYVQNVPVNAGPDWIVCNNAVARLGTAAQPNTTYLWEPQASPWQNGTSQASAQPEVLVATNLTFTVIATTSAGCISTDQVNITVNNSPTIPDAPDKLICAGNSVVIGSAALPGVTYQWLPVAGLNNPSIARPQARPTSTTTYTVLATFPGTCVLPASDQVIVTVSNPAFNLPDISFCPANGPVQLGLGAPVGMSDYNWSPYQLVTDYSIPNPSTLNPPPNTTTTFTLEVSNTDGCYYRDSITIIPTTISANAGSDKTMCKNQSEYIGSVMNETGPSITYSWSPATNLNNPSNPNPLFTATDNGVFTYIITKTDNSVSCISKDTVVITVNELLLPPLSTSTVCQNSCVQIGTEPSPGTQYHWMPSSGLSNPDIGNPIACVGSNAASYVLTAIDQNGCSASASVVVGVNSQLAPAISIPSVTVCSGDNNVSFNPVINPPGSYSYLWSPDNGTLSSIYSLNPSIIITGTGSTQYLLQVTNTISGCTSTTTANLTVNNCSSLATVGNFMWYDVNENGLQDPGEPGASGVNVKLYNDLGFNVSSTVTDVNGIFNFINISPGNGYYTIFNKPPGYAFTIQNAGGASALNNSKADINGRTNSFNIAPAESISNIDAGIKIDIVPVSLLSFTAVLNNSEVLLNWKTTAEYNNRYFDVERSFDGIHFTAIGRVQGNGTTSIPHNYSLIDNKPENGINYYRLKQVDYDGHVVYSFIILIKISITEVVSIQYNSQGNSLNISFSKQQKNTLVKLYADNGQLILSEKTKNTTGYTLKLPALATGVYFLQILGDLFIQSEKIFIHR